MVDLHYACNYSCPYCWYIQGELFTQMRKDQVYINLESWIDAWFNFYKRFGIAKIILNSGEPFIYPEIFKFLSELSKWHLISVNTNLSWDINSLTEQNIDFQKVSLSTSFHPYFISLEEFSRKIVELRKIVKINNVNVVAYPPLLNKLGSYRCHFNKLELDLNIFFFHGVYLNRKYPESYSEEEMLEITGKNAAEVDITDQLRSKKLVSLGKLCRAGIDSAVISRDGTINRCGQIEEALGNIFENNYQFYEQPKTCTSEFCKCSEAKFVA